MSYFTSLSQIAEPGKPHLKDPSSIRWTLCDPKHNKVQTLQWQHPGRGQQIGDGWPVTL